MKKTFTLLNLLILSFITQAQTITQSDHPVVGEVWIEFIDTTGGGMVISPPGSGQTFDFTNLTIHDTVGVLFQPLSAAPAYMNAASNFPGSGMCVLNTADSAGTFFGSDPDGFYLNGVYQPNLFSNPSVGLNISSITFDPGQLLIPTPFSYQDTRNHTSNFTFSFVPTGIPLPITVTVSSSNIQFMEADGEGTLISPFGTFSNVIRYKEFTYTVDSTDYSGIINSTVEYSDTTISYTFVKNGPQTVLASVDIDPVTLNSIRASYYDPFSVVGLGESNAAPVLYPNPASNQISLSNVRQNSTLEIFDYTGKLIKSIQSLGMGGRIIMHTEELSPGMYFLRMSESGKLYSSQKFQIIR
jgi:hypothetical protein